MAFALPFIGPWLLKKGIKGAMSTGIQIGILIFLALILYLAFDRIRNHFRHISDLEGEVKTLTTEKAKVEGQRDQAIQLNRDNERTRILGKDIEANNELIAGQERAAAAARAATYKEIGNAIRNTPTPPTQPGSTQPPVAPVITNTLDSLWRG